MFASEYSVRRQFVQSFLLCFPIPERPRNLKEIIEWGNQRVLWGNHCENPHGIAL
jgi:hypothetical protein